MIHEDIPYVNIARHPAPPPPPPPATLSNAQNKKCSDLLQVLVQRVDPLTGGEGDAIVVDAILAVNTHTMISLKPLYRSAVQVRESKGTKILLYSYVARDNAGVNSGGEVGAMRKIILL